MDLTTSVTTRGGRKTRAMCALAGALVVVALLCSTACAGRARYHYGDTWWREYPNDRQTLLLLHFGRPTPSARDTLVSALRDDEAQEITDADIDDINSMDGDGLGPSQDLFVDTESGLSETPIDDHAVPRGVVLDYGPARRTVHLGAGLLAGAGGRFGEGLICDGSGALRVVVDDPRCVECWFRVDALPRREVCVFAVASDESRVLVRPDGRIELRLKRPHGIPDRARVSEAALAHVLGKNPEIVSAEPIRAGEWVHVAIYNKPHPMPGGGEPWDARLKVNGTDVASYLSERYNTYHHFMGRGRTGIVIANSDAGDQGFEGMIDEVRVSSSIRGHYERPALPWRDPECARRVRFDRPYFREDGTTFHASLDRGSSLDIDKAGAKRISIDTGRHGTDGLLVDGIRGKGWVMDPAVGFARFPLAGMSQMEGALEFWLRPVNFDDMSGYWHHSPPLEKDLTVARFFGRDPQDGQSKVFMRVALPRAYNLERQRIPLDPGHWLHVAVVWNETDTKQAALFVDGRRHGTAWRAAEDILRRIAPQYLELGVSDEVAVKRGEPPVIEIDEIVGYSCALRDDEVGQARKRWMGDIEPIELYEAAHSFKYSLQKLEFRLTPLLPKDVVASSCTLRSLRDGTALGEPLSVQIENGRFEFVVNDGARLAHGEYRFEFEVRDAARRVVTEGVKKWEYREEPWREYRGGILADVPPPWTPIRADGLALHTRMSSYTLGRDGLPRSIRADGVELLASPVQLLEDGAPMKCRDFQLSPSGRVSAKWSSVFEGRACRLTMNCTLEYDGMIRVELSLTPNVPVGELTFLIPIKAERATRYLCHPMGARGVTTGVIARRDGIVLESRAPTAPYEVWQAYQKRRESDSRLTWEEYWEPIKAKMQRYGFFGHVDINDMNRGLWWFADNAAGWRQSKTKSAIEIVRAGDVVSLGLNLTAEAGTYESNAPIVFGILPHPARPMPEKYRLYERATPKSEPLASSIFDAFFPWPMDPRGASMSMTLFPCSDPNAPDDGPSWEYAQRCIPSMKAAKPSGYRTMYLSKAWFSCRAGAYDNWEWRSGESSTCSLTPYFVNYLCWEMNEWIGRGVFNAVYLDECYEHPARNVEAGMSVRLPDGTEQPGVTNFQFRELMKRWRNLFHAHGLTPMLIAHHTQSWQYHGLVFCDAYLDGENTPIVSLQSGDWIDSVSRDRFEVIQNGGLWGMSSFYMPFTAEGGFENKEKSQFLRWQWRMARQAQSLFAHCEVATTYEGQGASVHKAYWRDVLRWGAGDAAVRFHPYWDNAEYVTVQGAGQDTAVSFYRAEGRILLIASNWGQAPAVLRIDLDRQRLGLRGEPKGANWDSAYAAPQGEDYVSRRYASAVPQEDRAAELLDDIAVEEDEDLGLAGDLELDGNDSASARDAATRQPTFEGSTLILHVRGRDFRLVSVE